MSSINKLVATVVVVLCLTDGGLFKKIPDYIPVCKRDPATVDACVIKSIETLRPKLAEGIPELNVPALDPFYIPEIAAINTQNTQVRAVGKDVKVSGGGNFTIKSLQINLDNLSFKVRVRFPKLFFKGQYLLDTKIILPLSGKGALSAEAVKCDAEFTIKSELYDKEGVQYLRFVSITSDINIKDYSIKLEGLFNGDKVLGQAANEAINQNRGEFLKMTKPSLESTVNKLLLDISNKVVDDLPLDDLFPKQ
ncbi:uncharacterized protein LOC115442092 [Manduca sexta]|uniref:Uncharacterized protein n=1 Tax=Manduca sexta TaxID=7130 RepID=A0A921Z0A1_MANSE|nr:uncharacterized protein LOC115442092 [Manduca sexta]KAG6448014.1 hypothetical protein O3G_MSEX005286 [Manduca sexta]